MRYGSRRRSDGNLRPAVRSLYCCRFLVGRHSKRSLLRVRCGFKDERSGQWRLVAVRRQGRRRGPSVVSGLSKDGHLARRSLHDDEYVRLSGFRLRQRQL